MAPRHPCPNCGKLRTDAHASCSECLYPKHDRQTVEQAVIKHPPLQFHIKTLLACTFFAAIVCAILKKSGVEGVWLALDIVGVFLPIIEFTYYFWINLRTKNERHS